jgi:hypothetical protein
MALHAFGSGLGLLRFGVWCVPVLPCDILMFGWLLGLIVGKAAVGMPHVCLSFDAGGM